MNKRSKKGAIMHLKKQVSPKSYLKMPQQDAYIGMQVLSGNGFKFLTYMHTREDEKMFDPGAIAKLLGVTKRTVGTAYMELQEKGFMYIEHNKTYELCVLGLKRVAEYKEVHGVED